jgi:hypothetical protein
MKRIKAIPTQYRNLEFRSRLEARWAVWFDEMLIPWTYEPEGFIVDGVAYLPDFYVTSINKGVFVEIKPKGIDGNEKELALNRVKAFNGKLLLIIGNPMLGEYSCTIGDNDGLGAFVFADCRRCDGLCYSGADNSYWGEFGKHTCGDHDKNPQEQGERIMNAYKKAMSHRFGEQRIRGTFYANQANRTPLDAQTHIETQAQTVAKNKS